MTDKKINLTYLNPIPLVNLGLKNILENSQFQYIEHDISSYNTISNIQLFLLNNKIDICLVDLQKKNSPLINSLELIPWVNERKNLIKLINFTHEYESQFFDYCYRSGVAGYLIQQQSVFHLIMAFNRIANGAIYYPTINHLVNYSKLSNNSQDINLLSDREKEVFNLIGQGICPREIASTLGIKLKTVDNYKEKIKEKTNTKNTYELIRLACEYQIKKI